jgi:hypothetical protein
MASDSHGVPKPPSPEPIPLQDLSSDIHDADERGRLPAQNPSRQRSLLRGGAFTAELGRRLSSHRARRSYGRIPDQELPIPRPEDPDLQDPGYANEHDMPTVAELKDDFESALGRPGGQRGSWLPPRNLNDPVSPRVPPEDEAMLGSFPDEGETAHLTDAANQQPMSGFSPPAQGRANRLPAHDHSVRFGPGPSLGDDLNAAEEGMSNTMRNEETRSRSGSLLSVLSVDGGGPSRSPSTSKSRSLSPASSPVRRVSVAVQNMSQRVVNLSNDPRAVEQAMRRRASSKSHNDQGFKRPSVPEIEIHPYNEENSTQEKPITPLRNMAQKPWHEQTNPLRGNALRIFPPNHPVRLFLCDVLIHP